MRKKIVFSLLVSILVQWGHAQHTQVYTNRNVLFNQGKEYFMQRKFAASYRSFEDYLKSAEVINAGQIQEAEYYMAADAYELRQDNAWKLLTTYLIKHPYAPLS